MKTFIIFFLIITTISTYGTEPDQVEIYEALYAGLLSISFTGSDDKETLKLEIAKTLDIPLAIIIKKGITTFPHGYGEMSVNASAMRLIDLSDKMEDSIILPQTKDSRTSGTMTQRTTFSKKTALVYEKLKNAKNQLLDQLIESLNQDDPWIRKGTAKCLGEIGDVRAVEGLELISSNDPDEGVRLAAEDALRMINDSVE